MKVIRVGLHGLILVMVDIAGIGGGALAAFRIVEVPNQVWLQLPVAVVLSVSWFWLWLLSLQLLGLRRLQPIGAKELGACLAASILCAPLVFIPLHYFTQGYLTSSGNLMLLAVYQVPVNALAVYGASLFQNPAPDECTHH